MKEENLIFIISQPRSGSTYLQNLLSNNPETNTCSEPWLLLNFVNQLKPELVKSKVDNELAIGAFNNYLKKYPNYKHQKFLKKYLLSLYKPLSENYLFVVDKTPRYWEILDEIIELFPKSKIIILHRNPIDVIKSIVKTWGLKTFKELNLFRRDLLYAPKKLHAFCNKHKDNKHVYSITYEKLKANTHLETEKLYKWIGIPYNDLVIDITGNDKYKGEYGDPFQNSEDNYLVTKKKLQVKTIPKNLEKLISGYGEFLGKDFLNAYGYYNDNSSFKFKRTLAFKYFLHLGEDEKRSFGNFKNLKWFFKFFFFRILYGL